MFFINFRALYIDDKYSMNSVESECVLRLPIQCIEVTNTVY